MTYSLQLKSRPRTCRTAQDRFTESLLKKKFSNDFIFSRIALRKECHQRYRIFTEVLSPSRPPLHDHLFQIRYHSSRLMPL